TPASPPAATITPESTAVVADPPATAPVSAVTPAGVVSGSPARDRAAQLAASRAPVSAPRGLSQGSRPAAAKSGMDGRHNYPRVPKKAGTSLTDLLATPAFRNGTLHPGVDH